jgi:hypothetical protein
MGIFDDGYQQAIIHAARQPEPLMEISKPSRDSLHLGIAAGRPRTGHLFVIYAGLIENIYLARKAREAAAERSH